MNLSEYFVKLLSSTKVRNFIIRRIRTFVFRNTEERFQGLEILPIKEQQCRPNGSRNSLHDIGNSLHTDMTHYSSGLVYFSHRESIKS
jgi:hypothetical protein